MGGIYLVKTQFNPFPYNRAQEEYSSVCDMSGCEGIQSDDTQEASDVTSEALVKFEYHVVYSISFSVPVLYFNASKSDGSLVRLEEIWKCFSKTFTSEELNSQIESNDKQTEESILFGRFGSVLTQMEHPLLGRPFYAIHPCHTSTLLKKIYCTQEVNKENYLITWLSSIGPLAGLHLPLDYAKHISN